MKRAHVLISTHVDDLLFSGPEKFALSLVKKLHDAVGKLNAKLSAREGIVSSAIGVTTVSIHP